MRVRLLNDFKNLQILMRDLWLHFKYIHLHRLHQNFICAESAQLHTQHNWTLVTYMSACGPGSSVGIATGYGLDGPGIESLWGARFSAPVQTGPGAHPAPCTMGTESFPGVRSGRGVLLTPNPLLVPWSRKSRGMPPLPLWALRPVQSLNACTRLHFNFLYRSVAGPSGRAI